MENNTTLSEKALDELLGQSFLNMDLSQTKNQKIMETIANYNLGASGVGSSISGRSVATKILLVLSGLGIIATTIFFLSKNNNKPEANGSLVIPAEKKKADSIEAVKEEIIEKENQKAGKPYIDREAPLIVNNKQAEGEDAEIMPTEEIASYTTTIPQEAKKSEKAAYSFPTLTEKEIKANEKEKRKIAKLALKLPKAKYYPIPGMNFYMRTAELTNLEYRTFLFDLLIQGKKEEFLKAKPEQDLWINSNGTNKFDGNRDLYFSSERFNDYPVVNISAEGAEMYCKWLKELISDKLPACEVRLPYEKEWVVAAKAGRENATYPWGRDSIQNNGNRFLANCCMQKLKEKFNQPITYPSSMKINLNAYTTAGMALGMDTIAAALAYAYNPNDYYLYCMSGNVSEMVYINGTKNFKTKGGNWSSDFEHLKIDSEDEFKSVKPSPMIGFRPIIITGALK